jgi:hypothetical protein
MIDLSSTSSAQLAACGCAVALSRRPHVVEVSRIDAYWGDGMNHDLRASVVESQRPWSMCRASLPTSAME